MKKPPRFKERWIYAVFFGLVVIFFGDLIFLGKVLLLRDTFADFIPKLAVARRAFWDFAVPLWNPQTGCGHPYIADPYTGSAYPLNVLFYVMPMSFAHKVSLVLHLTLAGGGMIALARLWGYGIAAALLSAICFVFSTYVIGVMEFFNILFPVCWGPMVFYLGCLLYKRVESQNAGEGPVNRVVANWKTIAVLAACLACNYLAGNPQYLVFAIGLVSAYHAARLIRERDFKVAALSYFSFLSAGGIALLLCMPQILLFIELLGESLRSGGIDPETKKASMHRSHFVSTIYPFAFGKASWPDGYWAKTIFEFWLGTFYVGLLPLMTLCFAFRSVRTQKKGAEEARWARFLFIFFGVAVAGGIVLASGQYLPVYEALVAYLPGFDKIRWPSRFMLAWVYFVPLAAGLGLHLLVREKERGAALPRWFYAIPGTGAALAVLMWAGWFAGGDLSGIYASVAGRTAVLPDRLAMFRQDYLTAAFFLTLSVIPLWFLLRSRTAKTTQLMQYALVGVAFFNVALIGRRVHPASSDDVYSYRPEVWEQLRKESAGDPHWRFFTRYGRHQFSLNNVADPGVYRIAKLVSVGETWLQSDIDRAWRSSLGLDRYYTFYHLIGRVNDNAVALRFIDLLNVRYAMSGPPWNELLEKYPAVKPDVVPRESALPRAFLVKSWERPANFDDGLGRLASPEFDIHKQILIEPSESGEVPGRFSGDAGSAVNGRVVKLEYDWNEAILEIDAKESCLLVLVDSWFPGWKAFVDGNETPIFKANLLFRAIEIPAGTHRVVFEYKPVRWKIGWVLFAVGTAILGTGFVLKRKLVPPAVSAKR